MAYDYRYDWKHKEQRKANVGVIVKTYPTTNREFSRKDGHFLKACENSGVEPTSRQASKWRNKKGLAYENR